METNLAVNSQFALENLQSSSTQLKEKWPDTGQDQHLNDIVQRFKLWAGNIGAFHEPEDAKSLQHRVRAAPKLCARFSELLDDVQQGVEEMSSRLDGDVDIAGITEFYARFDNLIETLGESIRSLFKTSSIARRATTRDRYALALQRIGPTQVISEEVDVDLIGELFPPLRFSKFSSLRRRLARANNQRRRYLRFCEEHQRNVQAGGLPAQEEKDSLPSGSDVLSISDEARAETSSRFAKSTTTTANTALYDALHAARRDEVESMTSSSSYLTDATRSRRYRVIDLAKVNDGHDEFICPYCRQETCCKSQDSWEKHVFADLKAYICLENGCDCQLFENIQAWMQHQLTFHLREWCCPYCNDDTVFAKPQGLRRHLRERHRSKFHEEQLAQICKVSERQQHTVPISSCPFCDWYIGQEFVDTTQAPDGDARVSLRRYQRHIGSHLEQAALAVLAVEDSDQEPDTGDQDSGESSVNRASNNIDPVQIGLHPDGAPASTNDRKYNLHKSEQLPVRKSDLLSVGDWASSYEVFDLEENEAKLQQHLEQSEKQFGLDHPATQELVWHLGSLKQEQGKLQDAEALYQRALQDPGERLDFWRPSTLMSVHALGRLFQERGKTESATDLYLRVLASKERESARESLPILEALSSLAETCVEQGKVQDAEAIYRRVVRERETEQGVRNSATLQTLASLGEICIRQGKMQEAEVIYQQLLEERQALFGVEDRRALEAVATLSRMYEEQGRREEAEAMHLRMLKQRELSFGLEHFVSLEAVHAIGIVYEDWGRIMEAKQMYLRALRGMRNALEKRHPLIRDLAERLIRLDEISKAEGEGQG